MRHTSLLWRLSALCLWLLSGCGEQQNPAPRVLPLHNIALQQLVHQSSSRATLVNVWATWCDPCQEEIPDLIRLRNTYREKGLNLILLSADDLNEIDSTLQPMLEKLGVDFQTYINADSSEDAFIQGMDPAWSGALPTSFIYNRNGELVQVLVGRKSYGEFETIISGLL